MFDEMYDNTDELMDNPEDLIDNNDSDDKEDTEYLFNTQDFLKPETQGLNDDHSSVCSSIISEFVSQSPSGIFMIPSGTIIPDVSPEEQLKESLKNKTVSKSDIQMSIDDFRREVQMKVTQKDLIETVIEVASGYKSKGDKLDLLGWDILDTEKRHYKYVSLQQITDFSRRDTTIRKAVFRKSFMNFIRTGEKKFVPVLGDELVSFIIEEVFQSPDLLSSSQGYDMFRRLARGVRGDGTPFSVSELADTVRFSCTPDALRVKFNTLVSQNKNGNSTLVSYYAKHDISLDKDQLSQAFSERISTSCIRVVESGQFGFIPKEIVDTLQEMDSMIGDMLDDHLFHVIVGFAGSGKSHKAINDYFPTKVQKTKKGTLLVSLSTLVAINGADRASKQGKPTNPCSITMFNFCKSNPLRCSWVSDYDTYCIDEFSQWGLEQLDTFMSILKRAYKERAELVILGDLLQIGTFLGRGNLLYMLTANYPFTELDTNHRIKETQLNSLITDIRSRQARTFEPFRMDQVSLQAFIHAKPTDSEMCITGSNSYAGIVNELKLESVLKQSMTDALPNFYVPSGTSDWNDYDMWKQNEDWIRSRMKQTSIKVRPKENFRFEKGIGKSLRDSYNKKFLRNETCIAMMVSEYTVRIVSCVFQTGGEFKSANISWGDFIQNFVPYYAITVNKSQGLEWNDVVVLYGNPEKLDTRQGAYVPKKNYNLNSSDAVQATYVSISRPRESLRIFYDGIRTTRQNAPVFANHLDLLNEFDPNEGA